MKFAKKTLILLLTLALMLGATACKPSNEGIDGSDSGYSSDGENSALDGSTNSNENGEDFQGNGEEIKNDFSRYSIIATKTNALALDAATKLSEKLGDNNLSLPLNKSSVYEVIIGNNVAPETKTAINELSKTDKDYLIKFTETKILIVAKNDLILSEACDVFFEKYIKPMDNKILKFKDGAAAFGVSTEFTSLAYDGVAQYEIVIGNVSADVKSKASDLAEFIKATCGVSSVKSNASYNKSKKQILIGMSSFAETVSATSSLADGKGIIAKVNDKIVIAAKNDVDTLFTIDAFIKLLEDAKPSNTKKGNFAMAIKKSVIDTYCATLDSIPKFTGATYSTTYPSGSGIKQLYYTSADSSKINTYVSQLDKLGYKKTEDNTVNGNRFITCYGKNGLVHISYLNHNKSLSVILDSLENSVYKTSEPAYTKVTDASLAVMSLDYSGLSNKSDASGMSYVVTLEDGRYVIFDGGYYNKTNGKDHHILYNYLKDNNKRKDGKIVIAAWILTHDHSDHHGAFTNFALDYSSNVELQYYISNFGDKSRYDDKPSGWLDTGIPNDLVAPCYKNAKKIVPHTGQKITFCNTTFELLCSQESHVPNKIEWVNDASLIFKMTSNGVSTLFLADAEAQTTNLLNKMYGSTLKSDIMQIAHHGYSGGSISLYQNIDPSWTLWPTNQTCFEERTTDRGIGNAHAQNKWARNNSTCFVGDGNIEILKFVGGASKISISTYTPKNYKV